MKRQHHSTGSRVGLDEDIGGTAELADRVRIPREGRDFSETLYIKLLESTPSLVEGEAFIWDYEISGHAFPGGPVLWTGRLGRNGIEVGNTAGSASGYTITSVGNCPITGVEPAPAGTYFRATGPHLIAADTWRYFFEFPNIPIISSP